MKTLFFPKCQNLEGTIKSVCRKVKTSNFSPLLLRYPSKMNIFEKKQVFLNNTYQKVGRFKTHKKFHYQASLWKNRNLNFSHFHYSINFKMNFFDRNKFFAIDTCQKDSNFHNQKKLNHQTSLLFSVEKRIFLIFSIHSIPKWTLF